MKETAIALEHASPGFAELAARARREHTTFVILDAAVPVARLVPAPAFPCTGAEFARALDTQRKEDTFRQLMAPAHNLQ